MFKEERIKNEVSNIYINYALALGRDVSQVTIDTKLAFPAGLKLSDVQRKSRKPELNEILQRESATLFVDFEVMAFSTIKDAQNEVWSRVDSAA